MDILFWIGALFVFLFVEAMTTSLVSIWFALGSLVAGICSLLGLSETGCIMVFAVVSAVSVFVFKKFYNKNISPKHEPTNADRLIGKRGIVESDIDPVIGSGSVVIDGRVWSAKAGEYIEKDSVVVIEEISGVKLVVKKMEV